MTSDDGAPCCSRVVELLADYLDNHLPAAVQQALDQHLRKCDRCVAYLHTYRTTVSLLRDLCDSDLPDEVRTSALEFLGRHPPSSS